MRWPYMDAHIICHYIHADVRWPYIDAHGICHYAEQILGGFMWMQIMYVIIFMHIVGGLIWMRIACHYIHA